MISKERPLRVLTGMGGIRDIVVGLGFILGPAEVAALQLYQNYNALLWGISAPLVGAIFLAAGAIALLASIYDWPVFARKALWTQSFVWSFSTWMYLLTGDGFHAIVFGLLFSLPAAYTALHYKYRVSWVREQIELRRELEELRALLKAP